MREAPPAAQAVEKGDVETRGLFTEQIGPWLEGARSWAASLARCEELRRTIPSESWLTIRHEDLCRDPRATLARIFGFLGVSAPAGDLRDSRAGDHHIIGNRMRLSKISEIRLDERWRTELTPDQLRAIERIAGPGLARYRYAVD